MRFFWAWNRGKPWTQMPFFSALLGSRTRLRCAATRVFLIQSVFKVSWRSSENVENLLFWLYILLPSVAPHHKAILPGYEAHFDRMMECVKANNALFQDICEYSSQCMFWGYWPKGCVVKDVDKPTGLSFSPQILAMAMVAMVKRWCMRMEASPTEVLE